MVQRKLALSLAFALATFLAHYLWFLIALFSFGPPLRASILGHTDTDRERGRGRDQKAKDNAKANNVYVMLMSVSCQAQLQHTHTQTNMRLHMLRYMCECMLYSHTWVLGIVWLLYRPWEPGAGWRCLWSLALPWWHVAYEKK